MSLLRQCGTSKLLRQCGTGKLLRACPAPPEPPPTLCGYDTILATVSGFSGTEDCRCRGGPYEEGGKWKYAPYPKVILDSMPVVLSQGYVDIGGCAYHIDHPDCQFNGRIGTLEWWQLEADTEEELEALTCNDAIHVGGETIYLVVSAIAAPAWGIYNPAGKSEWAIYTGTWQDGVFYPGTYPSGIFKAWCVPDPFWQNSWCDHVNFGPVLQPDPGATEPYVSMVLPSTAPEQAWTLIYGEPCFSGYPAVTLEAP
jgi:hypothetical protein